MRYKYPHYYKKFQCSAQACEATCCAGWEIVIDDDSIEKYLHEKSEFGNRLCNSIDFTEGIFHQDENKRCAFLNDENLCDIYTELGEQALCYTCTQYPRHIEEFEDVNEVSLSISCPDVAEMILTTEEKITFYEEEVEEEVEGFEEFDFLFYEILYDAREVVFQILQNRKNSIKTRMKITQEMCKEIQERIDDNELFAIDEVVQAYLNVNEDSRDVIRSEEAFLKDYKSIQIHLMELYKLETLQCEWPIELMEHQKRLYSITYEEYREQKKSFMLTYQCELELMKEQLMIYFVYSYLCGAVYDGEVFAKYQLAHITTEIIEELWFSKYLGNNGKLTKKEMSRITYRYAREIEHSDQNLDILEEVYVRRD